MASAVRGGLVIVTLVLFAAPAPAAPLPDDLQLDRYPEVEIRADPAPNPHAAIECERCHTATERSYELARRFGVRIPLVIGDENPILLCEGCHKGGHASHPGNFRVDPASAAVPEQVFPLLRPLAGYARVTCTSCHAVHFPHGANSLLRGFPVDPRTDGGPFATRAEFCAGCHGDEGVVALSGHRTREGDGGCGLCHAPRDIAGKLGALRKDLNAVCSLCHPAAPGKRRHFYAYNPFPGLGSSELEGHGVALEGGRFTCATCHVHHRMPDDPAYLREGFVSAVSSSIRVNPHESTRICVTCHPVAPPPPGTPGAVAPLVEEDRTRLCRTCHAREGALRMDHPLGAPREGVSVPEGWPLRPDGSLGCETCHLAGHAPRDPANPRFLRGGPYAGRNEVCFRCHRESAYTGRNPHEGPRETGCDLCHEVQDRSAVNPAGIAGRLLAEPNLLCLRCHDSPSHPAGSEHTVMLRPRGFLAVDLEAIPISDGKTTCHSCHDSHAAAGADLLRTAGMACSPCHPF